MSEPSPQPQERTFLVVVDNTEELHVALRFASLRAKKTGGRVALLYVVEPADFQHWMAVEDLMREEGRQEAEAVLQKYSAEVQEWSGKTPVFYLREGKLRDELLKLIDEDQSISVLVLGAATGTEGPGPLISSLAGKMTSDLRVPLTIVPGYLTDEQLESLT
ncbi:MAG: universal stress protein [Alphaproteobacteria bacterium]|nr:universal stress protein [Alphaproteobacteria bacterium]MCZ6745060.1 universal stress protein [Alphaproteobacteria bacterium]TDI59386.1 MAG: universal stress protein [Alphaproteobacteria bacterium]